MNEPDDIDPAAVLLTTIRPADPSAELMLRLLASRPAATRPLPTARPKLIRFLPQLASAAAVFAVTAAATWYLIPRDVTQRPLAGNSPPASNPAAGPATFAGNRFLTPQQTSQKLLGVRDLGIGRDAQSRPVRLMQATWLDDNVYPQANGTPPVRESRVREEIVPVVLTTY